MDEFDFLKTKTLCSRGEIWKSRWVVGIDSQVTEVDSEISRTMGESIVLDEGNTTQVGDSLMMYLVAVEVTALFEWNI